MKVYTLGYQGINQDKYIETLTEAGVGIVIDVRETPWSHKRGFCKTALAEGLNANGIDYLHLKSAGNPSANRKSAKSIDECLSRYRVYIEDNNSCIPELLNHITIASLLGRPACLTCFEHLPSECHRTVLTDILEEMEAGIQVVHLPMRVNDRSEQSAVAALWVP